MDNLNSHVAGDDGGGSASDLKAVYEALHIGPAARQPHILLVNIQNLIRRNDCLGAVERTFFTFPTEPGEDDFGEPGAECLLNWGSNPAEYVEQFRKPLAARASALLPPVGGVQDSQQDILSQIAGPAAFARSVDSASSMTPGTARGVDYGFCDGVCDD